MAREDKKLSHKRRNHIPRMDTSTCPSTFESGGQGGHDALKRGIAIACRPTVRPSVCPSVTLVDPEHIGCKSWKLVVRTISPAALLFVAQRPSTYSQENMVKFGGDWRWGGKRGRAGAQKRQYL